MSLKNLIARKRAGSFAVVLCALLIGSNPAGAQDSLPQIADSWEKGRYENALEALIKYRDRTGQRDLQVDYMIATSACRLAAHKQTGSKFFEWILYNYNLSDENRQTIETERARCSMGAMPGTLQMSVPATLVGVRYLGKGGPDFGAKPSGNGTSAVVDPIAPEVFTRRLFQLGHWSEAESAIKQVLGQDVLVERAEHFMLVTVTPVRTTSGQGGTEGTRGEAGELVGVLNGMANVPNAAQNAPNRSRTVQAAPPNANAAEAAPQQPAAQSSPTKTVPPQSPLTSQSAPSCAPSPVQGPPPPGCGKLESKEEVGKALEQYLSFYEAKFGMKPPQNLISVYFTNSYGEIYTVARKLHGISVAGGSVGYSFAPDQSMVAWASSEAYGTFAHELFHLVVHQNFGDIPAWMDEGIAALYEVSETRGNEIVGLDNWRGAILQGGWSGRPKLRDLVQMNRKMFDQPRGNSKSLVAGEDEALVHATARYFMLYLQEQGKLVPLYKAFQERAMSAEPANQAILLTEQTLGDSMEHVDEQFEKWFLKTHPVR